jgi:hypothetical protein
VACGHDHSVSLCRPRPFLQVPAFGLVARALVLSFLEPISLGAVVGIGLVVGIVVRCWVRPSRDVKTSQKERYAVHLDRGCGL